MSDTTDFDALIKQVRQARLSYLKPLALRDLVDAVKEAEAQRRPGSIVECGTALGGSAIVMASAKSADREMRIYDAFGMIPPPTDADGPEVLARYGRIQSGESAGIRGDVYYGYREDLVSEVKASFLRFGIDVDSSGIELVKGYFHESLQVDFPVALAHLDGDWYESTMVCLERLVPHLVPGGRLVIDDYHYWQGCRRAVDEFFHGRDGFEFVKKRRLHVVRRDSGHDGDAAPAPQPR